MSNLVDRYLLYRIRTKRDPEAFAKIYDRYVEAIYRFILLKVPSKEDAQDLSAEVFTKTWSYLQDHEQVTHLRALLYRVARNLIVDFYRQHKPTVSLDAAVTFEVDFTSSSIEGLHDGGRDQRLMQAKAELGILLRRIRRLKDDYRDVLTLRLVDGLSFQDIASVLDKTPGNVRVIYHRALKALHDLQQHETES